MTDYTTFLTTLSQVMENLKEMKSKTNSALDTINTKFDLTEVVTTAGPSIGPITGIVSMVKSVDKENKNNEKIKNAVDSARNKLSVLDKWIDSNFAQKLANEINSMLKDQGWTTEEINTLMGNVEGEVRTVPVSYPEYYSYEEIRKNTKTQEIDVHEHGSYTSMTFGQIIFGDAAEDQTMAGTAVNIALQFVPVVDTVLDFRDVIADGYLWVKKGSSYSADEKAELAAFTTLDVVGFIPLIGAVKYSDEIADLVKSGKNLSKTSDAVKTMEKVKDIGNTADNVKDIGNTVDSIKNIGNTADNIKDIGNTADNVKDIGNTVDNIKDSGKNLDDATRAAKMKTDDIIKKVESGELDLKSKKQKGNYGEMKMDQHLENDLGYSRMGGADKRVTGLDDKLHKGIDGVYENASPPPKYIIAEAKYNTSKLNPKTKDGVQMSERWIKGQGRLENAVGAADAKKICKEMIEHPENVQKLLVNVKPDGTCVTEILK